MLVVIQHGKAILVQVNILIRLHFLFYLISRDDSIQENALCSRVMCSRCLSSGVKLGFVMRESPCPVRVCVDGVVSADQEVFIRTISSVEGSSKETCTTNQIPFSSTVPVAL